jgi:signal transduction histidine kinase
MPRTFQISDMGVAAALDAQARKAPIPVSVEAGGTGRYPQETEAAVYFCTLEALHNAAKHADPSRAIVRLSESIAELAFKVADDGRGSTPAPRAGAPPAGHGRPDRRTRRPRPSRFRSGQGTRISGRVPASAIS